MEHLDFERAHWQQIDDLFAEALDRPPDERVAFLDEACAGAARLCARVIALLAAHDQADDFLGPIDTEQAAALVESVGAPNRAGQRIGPYHVVRELGRGGMGAVFLAERADGQFEQRVALKLIKRGMDSEVILRRFLHERQILARLQHPNIAHLIDGNISDDGQPYFAMEYVEGVPLTDYCDAHTLDVEARLRLFEQVCRAVQYAHRRLVVHRDLKPSNMLVTEEGDLKLLDFGIAKVLGGDETDAGVATLTEAGVRAMTPEYAAPEQVRGELVTTATDVYALGVILYELLTGHRPYRFERRTPEAVAQVIVEIAPERPSTAVSRETAIRRDDGTTETITPERISQVRGMPPERLRRRLSGDLDVVVLKALKKEPEHRYASAEAFVEDIRRHLAGLPVEAQPDTLGYRASKFVRRHTVGVAFAAALGLVTLGAGVAMALQQAETAREAAKAEEVKDFVLSLFEVSDPAEAKGETITARALLDAGAARIETELAGQPEVQAEMMTVVGEVYQKLGLYAAAQPLLERALALRRSVLGDDHEDIAASLHTLASVLREQGDYAAAEPLVREALALRRRRLGAEHPDVAHSLNGLALVLDKQGNYAAAELLYREALALRRRVLDPQHPDLAVSLNNLARLLRRNGDYAAAEPLYRETLALRRATLGPEHPRVANSLNNLGALLNAKGDYDEAEPLYREALTMKRKLLGEEHPDVAIGLNNLACLLRDKGDYTAAEPLQREALALWRKQFGEGHPYIATGLNNLASLRRLQGDYETAEQLDREALAMKRRLLGEEHPDIAVGLNNLGASLRDQGDYDEAEPLLREALAMTRTLLGDEHPDVADNLYSLALLLADKGDYEAAEPLFREALAIRRKRLGPEHPRVASILYRLALLLRDKGDYEAAEPLFRDVLAMRRKLLGEGHPNTASPLVALGRLLLIQHRPNEAEPLLREGLQIREQALPEGHWLRASAQSTLGACLSALHRFDEAEPLLVAGYEGLREARGEQHATTVRAREDLAAHYERRGRPKQAAAYRLSGEEN